MQNSVHPSLTVFLPELMVALAISMGVQIGLADVFPLFCPFFAAVSIFCGEAVLLWRLSEPSRFSARLHRWLFVQTPFILLFLPATAYPVITFGFALGLAALLATIFFFYSRWRAPDRASIICIIVLMLPLFLTFAKHPHFRLSGMANEWRLLAEEGQMMGWITKVQHGGLPYRDALVTRGPFVIYLAAGFLKLFGNTLIMKRFLMLLLSGLFAYGYYYFCRRLFARQWLLWFAFLAMLMVHTFSYRTGLAILAITLYWGSNDNETQKSRFAAGVAAGIVLVISLLSSIEAAMSAFAAIAVASIVGLFRANEPRRYWLSGMATSAGIILALLPLMSFLALRGDLNDVIHGMVTYPKYAMEGFASNRFPNLWELVKTGVTSGDWNLLAIGRTLVMWYFPVCVYLFSFFLVCVWMTRGRLDSPQIKILVTAFYGWMLFHSALGRSDLRHLYFAVPVALALVLVYADRLLAAGAWKRPGGGRWAIGIAVAFPLVFLVQRPSDSLLPFARNVAEKVTGNYEVKSERNEFQTPGLKSIQASRKITERIDSVVREISEHRRPQDRIYAFPALPLYYFLLDSPNPTHYEWAYQAITHEMRMEAVHDLGVAKPAFIIYSVDPRQRLDKMPYSETVPELDEFIRKNYKRWASYGQEQILVPKSSVFDLSITSGQSEQDKIPYAEDQEE
jgi:hypothetical protein